MKKYLYIALLLLASTLCAHAETILLRTGARVKGEIVFQNEEVVIVRDAEGKRFQYLRSDVEEVLADDPAEVAAEASEKEQELLTPKKASILLELAGGAAVQPQEYAGGTFSIDLLVGSHHIGDRHLFVGGGLGYHGLFLNGEKLNFLPIQAAIRMPFTETKHAPVFGLGLGYGIATLLRISAIAAKSIPRQPSRWLPTPSSNKRKFPLSNTSMVFLSKEKPAETSFVQV